MAKTSAIVTYTDNDGKTCQKALSDINPEASNAEIKTFAQKLLGLTDNTYVSTDRVDKVNCDTEADTRLTPTLTISPSSATVAQAQSFDSGDQILVTYDGDGELYIANFSAFPGKKQFFMLYDKRLYVRGSGGSASGGETNPCVITIAATGTQNYKPATTTFTVTAS